MPAIWRAAEVRPHHHRDDRDGYAEAAQRSLAACTRSQLSAALRVLLLTGRIVEREFQIVNARSPSSPRAATLAVRRHRRLTFRLRRARASRETAGAGHSPGQDSLTDRQPVEHRSNLLEVEAIDAEGSR
jgi:hypothetical protein